MNEEDPRYELSIYDALNDDLIYTVEMNVRDISGASFEIRNVRTGELVCSGIIPHRRRDDG
jgi:hypothetical protein